jgi:hypothetical protein
VRGHRAVYDLGHPARGTGEHGRVSVAQSPSVTQHSAASFGRGWLPVRLASIPCGNGDRLFWGSKHIPKKEKRKEIQNLFSVVCSLAAHKGKLWSLYINKIGVKNIQSVAYMFYLRKSMFILV